MNTSKRRMGLVAAVAALALVAVASSAAQAATEGPFYKVAGARLAAGESKELRAANLEAFKLTMSANGIKVTCESTPFATTSKIIGSTGANPGTSEERLEFSRCSVVGNGAGCQIAGPLVTEPLKTTLGYATSGRTGKLLELLKPASGTLLVTFTFEGASCRVVGGIWVRGSVIAEVHNGGSAVEVGSEPAATAAQELALPEAPIAKIWIESAGTLTETSAALTSVGEADTLQAKWKQELVSSPLWGVFS
jgi:hypothetical protein